MDSVFDQQLLEGFVASLFQPKCFDLNFPLCRWAPLLINEALSNIRRRLVLEPQRPIFYAKTISPETP